MQPYAANNIPSARSRPTPAGSNATEGKNILEFVGDMKQCPTLAEARRRLFEAREFVLSIVVALLLVALMVSSA